MLPVHDQVCRRVPGHGASRLPVDVVLGRDTARWPAVAFRPREREGGQPRRRVPPDIEPLPLVEWREQVGLPGDALRQPQEQVPARLQGVVEGGQNALLQGGIEVDQQVPAGDQVEPREGRILDEIVRREQAHLPEISLVTR